MSSDLPVGQQSKGLPGPLLEVLDAYEARIRAQVAEDIAREIEQVVGGFPLNGLRRPKLERGLHVSDAVWAARIARKHGAKDSDSSPAALTDVVGTPELDGACHSVWLHGKWRWLTQQMTTPEKEAFADAVDRAGDVLADGESRLPVDRWWREPVRVDRLPEE